MPKAAPIQTSFNSGEFSPLTFGRVDADRYKTGLAKCLNFIPVAQGPITRRPASYYVGAVKDSTKKARLQRFTFSTTQAYILEFGDGYVRFYRNGGQILNAGVPVELAVPYTTADIFQLRFAQSADTLYVVHPSYPPAKIQRVSDTSWTYTVVFFQDGPYLDPVLAASAGSTTMDSSGGSGAGIIVTASSVNKINSNTGFQATDVGRLIRFVQGGAVSWGKITTVNNTTQVVVNLLFGSTTAATVTSWALGVWSRTTGYPACITFHEDRLCFGGGVNYPDRFDGSNVSDYENFEPTQADNSVIASNAISFNFNDRELNAVVWLASDEKGLLAGTVGGEWLVRPSAQNEGLSPTNTTAKSFSGYGSANVEPVRIGKAVMFLQVAARKLRELTFFYDVDGFRASDISLLSEHITGKGVVQMSVQKLPQQLVWCVRQDGELACLNYEREVDVLRAGWSRHTLGNGGSIYPAVCESVAVITDPTGTFDQVWLVVNRFINGQVVRTVEYLTKIFEGTDLPQDAFFVDAGLTYDQPITVTNITRAAPPVVTAAAHGLSNGAKVRFAQVMGLSSLVGRQAGVNGPTFTIGAVTTNTFTLVGEDFTNFAPYVSGGQVRKEVTTISGLDYLDQMTVDVLADGAVQTRKSVSAGSITLDNPATVVQVGFGYTSDAQLLRSDAGSADGTAMGKTRRVHRLGLMLYNTLGLRIGMDFSDLIPVNFRTARDTLTRAVALFTGIKSETIEADYDFENMVCIRQDQPLPATILAVMPQMETQDR